jgi:hypothetical protein
MQIEVKALVSVLQYFTRIRFLHVRNYKADNGEWKVRYFGIYQLSLTLESQIIE